MHRHGYTLVCSDAAVWFGPVLSEIFHTLDWTLGLVHQICRTLNLTYKNMFEGSGSGSSGSEL